MSTLKLIVLAGLCAIAILVAFATQYLISR